MTFCEKIHEHEGAHDVRRYSREADTERKNTVSLQTPLECLITARPLLQASQV